MSSELPHTVVAVVTGLQRAYMGACSDLQLGMRGADLPQRERLANILVRFFQEGERDVEALQRRAVIYFNNSRQASG